MSSELDFSHYPLSSDRPRSWVTVSIAEIARAVQSGFPSGAHNAHRQGVPHLRPMNVDREGRLDLSVLKHVDGDIPREVQAGDVLFNNTNSPELVGKTAVVTTRERLGYSNHMTRIALEAGLHPTFVAKQLHFLWMTGYFRHRCVNHVNQASISAEPLANTVPVAVPPSNEQERIADALDELFSDLDAAVAALERVRSKLKLYRASVLKAAVEGALTAGWREQHPDAEPASQLLQRILAERRRRWEEDQRAKYEAKGAMTPKNWKTKYREPQEPASGALPQLPPGWRWSAVEQLGDVRLGRQRAPQHHTGKHMRPYLRVANVYEDRLDLTDVKTMNFTPAEFETYALKFGDLLLNEGQSPELVGRPAMYRDEIPGCCYQKTLLRFRAYSGVEPAFALTVFRAYLHRGRFRASANITTSIAHLAAERFAPMEFPLPPSAEQEAIVEAVEDQLSVIDHLEADLDTKLKSAQALRQSILRHAFAGKLVPQDPNDEPASELLNRIAAERAASSKVQAVGIRRARTDSAVRVAR